MDILTAAFLSGSTMRCRSVGTAIRTAVLEVPVPPAHVLAGWQREAARELELAAGDIEPLPLGRTRLRWPPLRQCIEAARQWLAAHDLPEILGDAQIALMASRGTRYHHDGALYGGKAFCNLFLGEDDGTELHLPAASQRIALTRGTAILFDPCQPHAIIRRGAAGFDAADFAIEQRPAQVFLTWELPIEHAAVARALGVQLDAAPPPGALVQAEQVWRNGAPATFCPTTGGWLPAVAG